MRQLAASFTFVLAVPLFGALPVMSAPVPSGTPVTPELGVVQLTDASSTVVGPASVQEAPPAGQLLGATAGQVGAQAFAAPSGTVPTLETGMLETQDFQLVGVTWDEQDAGVPVDVQVRVKESGGWSGWESLPVEDAGPDADTEEARNATRVGTSPLLTSGADGVQVRVQAPAGTVPRDLRLDLVDPGSSPADAHLEGAQPAASAVAAGGRPPIISRAQWGADESLRSGSPSYSQAIKAGTLHHTASTNSYSAATAAQQMRSIYAYHTKANGWSDVGYNFLVDKYGRIYEGRAGGMDRAVLGAHAGGFNVGTFGVSAIGNYDVATAPEAMVDAIAQVFAWKLAVHKVNPNATAVLTSAGGGTARYAAGTEVRVPTIFPHKTTGRTACPGRYLEAKLGTIRARAGALAGPMAEASVNSSYIRGVYTDLLGRPADPGGLATWSAVLGSNGARRPAMLTQFANNDEYRVRVVTAAYQEVLGRAPDAGGRSTWVAELRAGRASVNDLRPRLMQSREIYLRGGGTDAGYVNTLYQGALGRSASTSERTFWSGVISRQGQGAVVAQIWGSDEAAMLRVDGAYRTYLGRAAAKAERQHWLPTSKGSGDERLREAVMVSAEYVQRAQRRFP